jgi:hypothetical protein
MPIPPLFGGAQYEIVQERRADVNFFQPQRPRSSCPNVQDVVFDCLAVARAQFRFVEDEVFDRIQAT